VLRTLFAFALVVSLPAPARAAPTAIAVMPFRDLAGGRGAVGEAIRETVAADLAGAAGLKVLERGQIDRVIAEQNLQAKRADLDAVSSVRLGTLLGARLIVAGAYQRAGAHIRLTARIVRVETGEILGSAKVDGAAADFLSLQDRVTGELLRSAGLAPLKLARRPKLRGARTIELYGDAVTEPDPHKRQRLLRAILDADPDFVYATRDLDALQARMGGYGQIASHQLAAEEQRALAKVGDAPAARELYGKMIGARRYHALETAAARLFEHGPAPLREESLYALFVARDRLHQFDQALQLGEQYLRDFPTGARFRELEARMHEIAETRKKRAARRAEWESDLREQRADHPRGEAFDYAPCITARWNNQVNGLMLTHCGAYLTRYASSADPEAREHVVAARFFVILALAEQGEFEKARPLADRLIADSDEWDEELRKLIAEWPTD